MPGKEPFSKSPTVLGTKSTIKIRCGARARCIRVSADASRASGDVHRPEDRSPAEMRRGAPVPGPSLLWDGCYAVAAERPPDGAAAGPGAARAGHHAARHAIRWRRSHTHDANTQPPDRR